MHLYVPRPTDPPPPTGFNGYLFRSWCLFVWLVMTYAILKMYYVLASIIAVGLGISVPEDWPDMFGNWSDAYTLRRLWGYVSRILLYPHMRLLTTLSSRTWHQNLRRVRLLSSVSPLVASH